MIALPVSRRTRLGPARAGSVPCAEAVAPGGTGGRLPPLWSLMTALAPALASAIRPPGWRRRTRLPRRRPSAGRVPAREWSGGQNADDPALVHDGDPVGQRVDLVELGRDDQRPPTPLSRWATIRLCTNSIEPTSRPRVGWLASSTLHVAAHLAGDDHLLLVAAGQRARVVSAPTWSARRTPAPGWSPTRGWRPGSGRCPEAYGGRSKTSRIRLSATENSPTRPSS